MPIARTPTSKAAPSSVPWLSVKSANVATSVIGACTTGRIPADRASGRRVMQHHGAVTAAGLGFAKRHGAQVLDLAEFHRCARVDDCKTSTDGDANRFIVVCKGVFFHGRANALSKHQ